jgi:RNA polymerase sigma factor (sigma-70 family)
MSTVNEAYEAYRGDPSEENYEKLYTATIKYALNIGHNLFGDYSPPRFHHACVNAATNALLDFSEKFKPERGSFSTWAHLSIEGDLRDWRRKRERWREERIDESKARGSHYSEDHDSRVALEKLLSTFSEDDRRLWQMKVDGTDLSSMASRLDVSLATVKRRWDALQEKVRSAVVR